MSQVTIADIYWIMTFLATSKNEPNKRKTSLLVMPKTCLSRVSWELYFVKYLPRHKKSYKRRPLGLWLTWYSRSFFQFHVLQSFQASHNLRFSLSFVDFATILSLALVVATKKTEKKNKRRRGNSLYVFLYCSSVVVQSGCLLYFLLRPKIFQ